MTWELDAFNTYRHKKEIEALGGVSSGINDTRLDRGDFGGVWKFPDETSYQKACDILTGINGHRTDTQVCSVCSRSLTLDNFGKDANRRNGRIARCHGCKGTKKGSSTSPSVHAVAYKERLLGFIEEFSRRVAKAREELAHCTYILDGYTADAETLGLVVVGDENAMGREIDVNAEGDTDFEGAADVEDVKDAVVSVANKNVMTSF